MLWETWALEVIYVWRSLVARLIWDQKAVGSNPTSQTICSDNSVGRMPACQAGCHGFESRSLLQQVVQANAFERGSSPSSKVGAHKAASCIVSVAATSRSSKPWSWVQIPYDTPSSVPERLGTSLENQGEVTLYRVRLPGARPYTPIIQWQNRRLLIVLSQFNSGWEYHISHQVSE